jgi:hypothetical protein
MGERVYTVSSRMSKEELDELDRRRGRIRRGAFLRNVFLGKKEPRQIPEVNREKYIETARWAANLNQLSRSLNAGNGVDVAELQRILSGFRLSLLGLTGEDGGDDS